MMFSHGSNQRICSFGPSVAIRGLAFSILAALSTSGSCALAQLVASTPLLAQSAAKLSGPGNLAKNSTAPKNSSKPAWQDLTPTQQLSLRPLAANWNTLEETQKRKWIAIARSYSTLAPAEQEKLHSRMTEWVSLSKTQRARARLNFAESKQIDPAHKTATWQAYQALSPEERQKLAASANARPTGAAAAMKPVAPQKLAVVPVTRQTHKQTPRLSAANQSVNRNTLLPHPQPPVEPAPPQKN